MMGIVAVAVNYMKKKNICNVDYLRYIYISSMRVT